MMIFMLVVLIIWIYVLSVMKRGRLTFWYFLTGSVGLFLFMIVFVQDPMTPVLSHAVTMAAGIVGKLTGTFYSYYQYSLLFVNHGTETITLVIDYECSGVIEMMAYLALLVFFPVYNIIEKFVTGAFGILWIFVSNVLRIVIIAFMVHFGGNDIFFLAHAVVGRLVFYALTITLYFYVFTRSQIIRQKVGAFKYTRET
ncbi:MAG: exosortase family protein XrtG [Lachnospiraceae bacterium]|jgi:exosortase family protein XrtG|nr:exosortase family protein XrtG [Lachnospiraceae bacterium]MEE3460952.1 exosortase family protein XrtG [Lachnospiraceae bacterium]